MSDNHSVTKDQINQTFQDLLDEDHIMSELSLQNVSNEKSLFFHNFSDADQSRFDVDQLESDDDQFEFDDNQLEFDDNQSEFDIEQLTNNEANITNNFIMRTDLKRKLRLKYFTSIAQKKLLNIVRKELQSSVEEDEIIIDFHEKNYHTEYTIKYLHFITRFVIRNVIESLFHKNHHSNH
jgi:hypothetical protein